MDKFISSVEKRHLPDDLQDVAEIIGLDNVKKLLMEAPGTSIYVPIRMKSEFYKEYIFKHYDPVKKNVRQIAKDLCLTTRTVYEMLQAKRKASVR